MLEFVLNALRLNEGFAESLFEQRTGLPISSLQPGLEKAGALGLLERDAGRIFTTRLGARFLNDAVGAFMSDPPDAGGLVSSAE